ncbi:MAG: hypothetical protein ACYCVD_18725 [Desulfitobacteriaceae bacterium]
MARREERLKELESELKAAKHEVLAVKTESALAEITWQWIESEYDVGGTKFFLA